MANDYLGTLTLAGQQKVAASVGGTPLVLQAVRVGDGNGTVITPNETMVDLVHRVGNAYGILSSGRDPVNPQMWRISALIPASDGPFDIREIGVFDADGAMIAIARHPLVEKRGPGQGVGVELTTDIVFPVSSTARVTVNFLPDVAVDIARLMRPPFISVNSVTVQSPPALPSQGDTYLVPAAPTGAWNGAVGKLAMWNGIVWRIADAPVGTVVAASDTGKYWHRDAASWSEWVASTDRPGIIELATNTETQAGTDATRAVTPAGLASRTATTSRTGLVELATDAETQAGTDATRAVTPAGLKSAIPQFAGRLLGIRTFTASGTYIPTPGTTFIIVEGCGGGGAGGGANNPPAGTFSHGAPGGSASSGRAMYTAAQIGASTGVLIGSGGVAAAASAGGDGGSTWLGSLLNIPGGLGGGMLLNNSPPSSYGTLGVAPPPSGANISGKNGATPGYSTSLSQTLNAQYVGPSGDTPYGTGVPNYINTNGANGVGYGSGGAGVVISTGNGPAHGGNGAPGILIIQEFGA